MKLFGNRKKQEPAVHFDPETQYAVIRSSICTGEKVAGFQHLNSNDFQEVMLIRNDRDLQDFRKQYGIEEDRHGWTTIVIE